jgi:hypothetical protein
VPQVRATVVTIETTIQPANKKFAHSLTIANNRARSGDELDEWRLFDMKANTVSYINSVTKTIRTQPVATLATQRRTADGAQIPSYIPRAQVSASGDKITIRSGGYTRTLTIAQNASIPPQLFSMMHASDPVTSPFAPMMKSADDALLSVRGFPMNDHAEVALDGKKLVVDRNVVKVEQKDVDASWLEVPSGFAAPATPGAAPQKTTSAEDWRFFWRRPR